MARFGGLVVAGCGLLAVSVVAAGCASPPKAPVSKPPGVVVPGVVPGGGGAGGGSGGSGPGGSGSSGRAGSRGTVLLGGWAPGGARDGVAAGALAYFRWLNARGGVFGRRVVYKVLDDRGNLRIVPSLVHQLVQGEAVFAVFGAAGVQGTAVRGSWTPQGCRMCSRGRSARARAHRRVCPRCSGGPWGRRGRARSWARMWRGTTWARKWRCCTGRDGPGAAGGRPVKDGAAKNPIWYRCHSKRRVCLRSRVVRQAGPDSHRDQCDAPTDRCR